MDLIAFPGPERKQGDLLRCGGLGQGGGGADGELCSDFGWSDSHLLRDDCDGQDQGR